MDLTQTILLAVIIILAIALVVIGFQAYYVLKDLRLTLRRMNKFFDETNELVSEVKKPIERAGTFFTALTTGANIISLLKKGKEHERSDKK